MSGLVTQTPAAFKMFSLAEEDGGQFDTLRRVILGDEALDLVILRKWYERNGKRGTELYNMYGTTETTVHATCFKVNHLECNNSIGKPLPDLRLYLLDPQREPVPLGAEGELYIGGAGVTRGYLNRPDHNANHFLPDHFSGTPRARMYRTGDKARYLSA